VLDFWFGHFKKIEVLMNTKNLLEQLLGAGGKNQNSASSSGGIADAVSGLISGKGGALMAGGALGLLLGSKSGRKMGGKVLKYGGLAAVGVLAYKAYQNYQQKSSNTAPQQPMRPLAELPAAESETHCTAILVALIAASKADGHIDDRERQLIDGEVIKLTNDSALQAWFDRELKKPLDPAEVARHAKDQSMAAEMYLASLVAVDETNFMEKSYIDELARQLKLPPALQAELTQQAKQAMLAV
jgi:uncharacterized membrane protein YebE (DUF533 family)